MGVEVGIGSQNPRPVAEDATRTGHPPPELVYNQKLTLKLKDTPWHSTKYL